MYNKILKLLNIEFWNIPTDPSFFTLVFYSFVVLNLLMRMICYKVLGFISIVALFKNQFITDKLNNLIDYYNTGKLY